MKNKSIFLGILLVSVGILWILKSLGVIYFSWLIFFKLWPLILVWVGIKLLPIQDKWKIILNTMVLFLGIAFLLIYSNSKCCNSRWNHFSICSREWNIDDAAATVSIKNQSVIKYEENFENAHLDLTASAGNLVFKTGEELIAIREVETSGSKINIISKIEDDNSIDIKAEVHPLKGKIVGNNSHKYNILLNNSPIWDMDLDLKAAAGEIDLSEFKVKELEIESNASALELKIGNLYPEVNIKIESNASSVELTIPKNMKCFLKKADSTLSSFSVSGLTKETNTRYVSTGDDETAGVINITMETNVSSVEVKRY
jgi:hypothetical protein